MKKIIWIVIFLLHLCHFSNTIVAISGIPIAVILIYDFLNDLVLLPVMYLIRYLRKKL
jgi:hypothetical protein